MDIKSRQQLKTVSAPAQRATIPLVRPGQTDNELTETEESGEGEYETGQSLVAPTEEKRPAGMMLITVAAVAVVGFFLLSRSKPKRRKSKR